MKRDMDLIRSLLLQIEGGEKEFNATTDDVNEIMGEKPTGLTRDESEKLYNHLDLAETAGFIEISRKIGHTLYVEKITWEGYDFIDSVRDQVIWDMTKKSVKEAGGFSVDILKAVARGFIKKQIVKATDIEFDI